MIISPMNNIVRSVDMNRKLNVLIYTFDGCFEYYISRACPEYNFFCLQQTTKIQWDTNIWAPGNNLHVCTSIPEHITIDCVVCNDISQYQPAKQLSNTLHIPIIFVEHVNIKHDVKEKIHYATYDIKNRSDIDALPYGIMEMQATNTKKEAIIISNFTAQDIILVQDIIRQSPIPVRVFGNNVNIAQNLYGIYSYINILEDSLIYIHITSDINMPMNILHAMGAGCITIAGPTPVLENIITKDNGCIAKSMAEVLSTIENIANNPEKYTHISNNAQQYIRDKFNIERFNTKWNDIFTNIKHGVFRHED